jgi:hypothetical protein
MITVKYGEKKKVAVNCYIRDLCLKYNDGIYPSSIRKVFGSALVTSFIGKCGYGPEDSLYIVTHDHIFLATDPIYMLWTSKDCSVIINEIVDIEMSVVFRKS